MTQLVLTVVGDDRTGLVQALADVVAAHDGNWERSELAELAGAFAGIVLISVPDARADELRAALDGLDGLLRVQVHSSPSGGARHPSTRHPSVPARPHRTRRVRHRRRCVSPCWATIVRASFETSATR